MNTDMIKLLYRTLVAALTVSSSGLLLEMNALAEDVSENKESSKAVESTEMPQVTSVSQLDDVKPTDWAFGALQSLVERYGCIAGFPDSTYRGNRVLTRYEFAAGLNNCLERINQLLAQANGDFITKEDLTTIEQLQTTFQAELAQLRGRVDAVETKTAELETNQFSTTTKLSGQVITYLANAFGEDARRANNATFGYRAIISLNTSFTGKDNLGLTMLAGNFQRFNTAAKFPQTSLSGRTGEIALNGGTGSNSELGLVGVQYQLPLGKKLLFSVDASSDSRVLTESITPLGSPRTGTVSFFGAINPMLYSISTSTGLGLQWQATDWMKIDFSAGRQDRANEPTQGLFGGDNGYAFSIRPVLDFGKLKMAFPFIYGYSPQNGVDTGSGSNAAKVIGAGPVFANTYMAGLSYRFSPSFEFGGSVGYLKARAVGDGTKGDADVWDYRLNLAIYDLGKKGNLAGIVFGMQPRLTGTSNDGLAQAIGLPPGQRSDRDVGYHIEAFYTYKINDNIAITPGVFWLTAPNHDERNRDTVIGVIRSSFSF
jgi:hypothetical protein